jgi:ABC-type lipoprotein export system ATPase subunit
MFHLKDVRPAPIPNSMLEQSNIWASDLQLVKGKNYLVSAASGKGKSTFLHAMYGLRNDYTGSVEFDNQLVTNFELEQWAIIRQEKIAIVFQDLRLFLDLTGLENIQLKANLTNTKSEIEILKMAKCLDVSEILNQSCGTMSYGQRQRIAIIRALCQPFDYLFLDEPFSHLDAENIKKAGHLITEVCQEQSAGYILVSLGENYDLSYDILLNL